MPAETSPAISAGAPASFEWSLWLYYPSKLNDRPPSSLQPAVWKVSASMKKLAIFDMDGTLLDTLEDLARSCNHTLEQFGYPLHDTQQYKAFVGNGARKLVERMLPADSRSPGG